MEPQLAEFIELARALRDSGLYGKAFEVYLETVSRSRALASLHRNEVLNVLDKVNNTLAKRGRMERIFYNFKKTMRVYPTCIHLMNDLGRYLFKYGFYQEAYKYFERVLFVDPLQVTAEKNRNSIMNLLVERWNFRMLNDNLRNEAYRQAIKIELKHKRDKVIDVGTGTGLLAIYACNAGAIDIVACDVSNTMTDLANAIVKKNKLTKNIKLINKMSTSMSRVDLHGEAKLLLTEMFDAGLLGEHVLQMLQHAWPNLLSQRARVIPNRAEFFILGAQCNNLNMKYQLSHAAKKLLNLKNQYIHVSAPNDTYDCEDVNLQKDIKYLTEAQSILKVNFNDLKDIEMHLNRTEPYKVELEASESGMVNTIIGWFNLYLSDTITITTDPRSETRCYAWQQAVFFDELPRMVKEGDIINLEFLMNGGHFTLKQSSDVKITRVSTEIVKFLNDEEYMNTITSSIPIATEYLSQIEDMSQISIADLCPFPVFGMLLMKRGASSLLCCSKNENDKMFFVEVFKENGIPLTNVTILVGNNWTVDDLRGEKYHTIFAHYLEQGGDMDSRLRAITFNLKNSHLHTGGLFMPANLWVVGQLISSRWLDDNNTLYDENVGDFGMANFVNKYSVNTNYFVDFSILKYDPLTIPVQICQYPEGSAFERNRERTSVIKDGYPNAILCSYNIELIKDLKMVSTDRPNSFMDGMLFMTGSVEPLYTGTVIRLLLIRDEDTFKLIFRRD